MKRVLLLAILLSWAARFYAQSARRYDRNNHAWIMYFGDHKISKNWGIHLEAQWRRHQWLNDPQQLLLRTGINYHLGPAAFVTLGYCYVKTYPYGEWASPIAFSEHRLWQQLQIRQQLNRFELINRFRWEQRFIQLPVANGTGYIPGDAVFQHRFRLLNRISMPLKGKTIVDKSFYASVYDELLINMGKQIRLNLLDQNRAYVALGYKIPKAGRLEIGYLQQLIIKGDGMRIENNHTLQLGFSSTLDLMRK